MASIGRAPGVYQSGPCGATEKRARLLRYTWQACASFASSNGFQSAPRLAEGPLPSRDELADRAIATNDEHAIKFTDACFREYALDPKPVYIRAAQDGVARLG